MRRRRDAQLEADGSSDELAVSIAMWLHIDPHVLLFSFLPLLLFGDAMTLNVHHLRQKLAQCLLLALPGVLFGTFVTGYVAYALFLGEDSPGGHGWSLGLCLTARGRSSPCYLCCELLLRVCFADWPTGGALNERTRTNACGDIRARDDRARRRCRRRSSARSSRRPTRSRSSRC